MDETDSTAATPPKQFTLAKLGWWIGGVGFLLALGAVAILGQGATKLETAAAVVHRFALFIMLVGMMTALVGHRASWLKDRVHLLRTTQLEPPVLDAYVLDFDPATRPPAPLSNVARLDEPLVPLAIVFCLTVGLASGAAIMLLLDYTTGLIMAGMLNILLALALVLIAGFGKLYLRAFALGGLVPVFFLMCITPSLFMAAGGQNVFLDRLTSPQLLVMFGWLSIIPAGLLGVMALVATRGMRGQNRGGAG